ncbi:MAG: hypothetical protein ACT4PP_15945 [Sporichthyaceae bacterium]
MAKAILGHIGGPDPRMINEMRRMQRRIAELESELRRVRAENDALAAELHSAELHSGDLLTVPIAEPALT